MSRKINVGDIDSALESGMLELKRIPSSVFSKDKDDARDREVEAAIKNLNYLRVKEEIRKVVNQTIEILYSNPRLRRLLSCQNHVGLTDDVIKEIYLKYYQK